MFKEIADLLTPSQVVELQRMASSASFVDGRITNPHSRVKNNLLINDASAYQQSSQIILRALQAHEDFLNFAFPAVIAPPLVTRYTSGMRYGAHPDTAFMQSGSGPLRSDLSCTVFLNAPEDYEGGALCIQLGTRHVRFKGKAGGAIVYPSNTLHEVETVISGERLVAISFIQSRIRDNERRALLYDLNEVAALEGLRMSHDNFTRLQSVQNNLLRMWGD